MSDQYNDAGKIKSFEFYIINNVFAGGGGEQEKGTAGGPPTLNFCTIILVAKNTAYM